MIRVASKPATQRIGRAHCKAASIPVDKPHAIAALQEEHVQAAIERIEFELAAHDRRQAIPRFSARNGLRRDDDPGWLSRASSSRSSRAVRLFAGTVFDP